MQKSFALLISSVLAAGMMTGCAGLAPSPDNVDIEAAKKSKTPVVIYHVSVAKEENGMQRPVVYFVNTSPKPLTVATFQVEAHTADGRTALLWADDYETVPPGKASQNGALGSGWKGMDVKCVRLRQAGLEIGGDELKFSEENIAQLFQDASVNECP